MSRLTRDSAKAKRASKKALKKKALLYRPTYNLQKPIVEPTGGCFFPTIIVTPDEVGVSVYRGKTIHMEPT